MSKKIIAFCVLLFMVLQTVTEVRGEEPSKNTPVLDTGIGVSAYYMDDRFYAFVKLPDDYSGKAKINGGNLESTPEQVAGSDAVIRYMLMVDLSGTMKNEWIQNEIKAFIQSLMSETGNSYFELTSFGEDFNIEQIEYLSGSDDLDKLEYNQQWTDPYNGLKSALNYLDNRSDGDKGRHKGDIVNLVLITDGCVDLNPDKYTSEEESGLAKSTIETMMEKTGVIVHTLQVHTDSEYEPQDDFNSLTQAAKGMNLVVDANQDGTGAGQEMAAFVNHLYRVGFQRPEQKTSAVDLTFLDEGIKNVHWDYVQEIRGEEPGGSDLEEPNGFDSEEPAPGYNSPDGMEPGDLPINSGEPQDEPESKNEEIEPEAEKEINVEDNVIKPDKKILMICIAAVFVCLAALFLVLFSRKRDADSKEEGHAGYRSDDALHMKLEIISGRCTVSRREFCLTDQLMIGSAPDCDLTWAGHEISPHNTRIFLKNQTVYIEDLGSKKGTVLAGMQLHAPNRLRSGDQISIGSIRFLFRF